MRVKNTNNAAPQVEQRLGSKRCDNHNDSWKPALDYSFMETNSLSDITKEEPRRGERANHDEDTDETEPSTHGAIRLSNNKLQSMVGLDACIAEVLERPELVGWIDVSFNQLSRLDEPLFVFQQLSTLYLHANNIRSLSEVDKLVRIPSLRSLTLHGNPIELHKGYRYYVINKLTQLQQLNFTPITSRERMEAQLWKKRGGEKDLRRRIRAAKAQKPQAKEQSDEATVVASTGAE